MKLFLISARFKCGKDTVAGFISELLPDTEDFKFAKGVKDCAILMGWDGKKDDKGRNLLQFIGKTGRSYNQDHWVSQTHELILENLWSGIISYETVLTISDWRFTNEVSFLKSTEKYDIISVRIESPEREQRDSPYYNDESEISLPSGQEFPEYYDYVIWNTGSLDDLKNKVRTMLIDLKMIKE